MSLDRRSFRLGVVAGTFLIIVIVSGVFLSAGRGWMCDAVSAPVAAPAGPVAGNGSGFASVARAAMPAVVNIATSRTVRQPGGPASPFMNDPLFRYTSSATSTSASSTSRASGAKTASAAA